MQEDQQFEMLNLIFVSANIDLEVSKSSQTPAQSSDWRFGRRMSDSSFATLAAIVANLSAHRYIRPSSICAGGVVQ